MIYPGEGIVRLFVVCSTGLSEWSSGVHFTREILPNIENIGSGVSIRTGRKAVAFWAEQCGGLVMSRQKSLRLSG